METITSSQNPTIKQLKKLISSGKSRRDEGLYVAEGVHLVQSYLASGGVPATYVRSELAIENNEISGLVERMDSASVKGIVVADSLFESLSSIHAAVGLIILFTIPESDINQALPLNTDTVLLDDIQDPGNLGTILRSASATGVKNVFLSPGCASAWSPKSLRAGMGAQFLMNIYENMSLTSAVESSNIPVYATMLSSDSISLYNVDLTGPVAWVFGNEGQGISEELAKLADSRITIPQAQDSVESLNVAAATAVCLYERYRQARL